MTANIKPEEIAPMVSELRANWLSGRTRPAQYRRDQLQQLKRMLVENYEAFVEAQMKDFRKNHLANIEVTACITAIDEQLEDLDSQMKPRSAEIGVASIGGSAYIVPEPYGVVAIFSAWNYPLHVLLTPAVGAIAAGNCVVLKPSEIAVNCSDLYVKLVPRYMDAKTFRVVAGPVAVSSAMLDVKFDYICFTGSTAVGKLIYQAAAKHLTPVMLELGGKSPVYLHRDANLEQAATRLAWGKYMNCGQTCIAPDYLLIDDSVRDKFLPLLVKKIKQFYGDDASKSKDYEQVVSDRHVSRIAGLLKGQNAFYGGRVDEKSRYIEPSIVVDPKPDSPLMQEEIFGPVLPVLSVKTPEEAIRFINARPKPLSLYVFSTNSDLQQKFLRETSAGAVVTNDVFMHSITPGLPFGGVGESGLGAYHGKFTFEAFSHMKPVLYAPTLPDPSFRFPPYTDQGMALSKLVMFKLSMRKLKRWLGVAGLALFALGAYFIYHRYLKN